MTIEQLFCELWLEAERATPTEREHADVLWPMARGRLRACLAHDDPAVAVSGLSTFLAEKAGVNPLGALLSVMQAIDEAFGKVHPRGSHLSPGIPRPDPPEWLEELSAIRARSGNYAQYQDRTLLPRGPMTRWPTRTIGASADVLANRFTYLSLAKNQTHENGRPISVTTSVVGQYDLTGVIPSAQSGSERIAFAPIAENRDDLIPLVVDSGVKKFLHIEPSPTLAPGQSLHQLCVSCGEIDLIFAPELVMTAQGGRDLSVALSNETRPRPRLVLSGSGLTEEKCNLDLSWNEASVYNRSGRLLWKQRKLVPYRMSGKNAFDQGLVDDQSDLPELASSGDTIHIADVDTFGRVVIFICQDFEIHGLVEQILQDFQPDWVLVPVLDRGVDVRRWPHLRAFGTSSMGQSRFMVSSSLSTFFWTRPGASPPPEVPPVGLAVGPRDLHANEIEGPANNDRMLAVASLVAGSSPRVATIQWRQGHWTQTSVGAM